VGERSLYGYVAFRGWKPDYKFQACGIDIRPNLVEQALKGKDFQRDENCSDSVGPFPYAGGNLVCMGQVLARTLAADRHFDKFVRKAHERNDDGIKCKSPLECAAQPWARHMWHHEDAGISYNLFRALLRAKLTGLRVVKIQPWVHIQHWLRDNITEPIPLVVVHNLKGPKLLASAIGTWRTAIGPWEFESERPACKPCAQLWSWKWARTCIAESEGDACEAMHELDPNDVYECCVKGYPAEVMTRMNAEEHARMLADRAARAAQAEAEAARKATREASRAKPASGGAVKGNASLAVAAAAAAHTAEAKAAALKAAAALTADAAAASAAFKGSAAGGR
jgi:hypothetical protein